MPSTHMNRVTLYGNCHKFWYRHSLEENTTRKWESCEECKKRKKGMTRSPPLIPLEGEYWSVDLFELQQPNFLVMVNKMSQNTLCKQVSYKKATMTKKVFRE